MKWTRVVALAAATAALAACSGPEKVHDPQADVVPTQPVETTGSPLPRLKDDPEVVDFSLLYVQPTAAACSSVWVPGAVLPRRYEWCADENGDPVAGVRIGSCEVVTYQNQMWGIPGRRIRTVGNGLLGDPGYTGALTSCKRQTYASASPTGNRATDQR